MTHAPKKQVRTVEFGQGEILETNRCVYPLIGHDKQHFQDHELPGIVTILTVYAIGEEGGLELIYTVHVLGEKRTLKVNYNPRWIENDYDVKYANIEIIVDYHKFGFYDALKDHRTIHLMDNVLTESVRIDGNSVKSDYPGQEYYSLDALISTLEYIQPQLEIVLRQAAAYKIYLAEVKVNENKPTSEEENKTNPELEVAPAPMVGFENIPPPLALPELISYLKRVQNLYKPSD